MQRLAIGHLPNLLAATEAIRNDERVLCRASDSRKERALAASNGNVVMIFFKTECAGHAATPGIEHLKIEAVFFQQFVVALHFHERFVMTMAVKEGLARESGRLVIGCKFLEELSKGECLF